MESTESFEQTTKLVERVTEPGEQNVVGPDSSIELETCRAGDGHDSASGEPSQEPVVSAAGAVATMGTLFDRVCSQPDYWGSLSFRKSLGRSFAFHGLLFVLVSIICSQASRIQLPDPLQLVNIELAKVDLSNSVSPLAALNPDGSGQKGQIETPIPLHSMRRAIVSEPVPAKLTAAVSASEVKKTENFAPKQQSSAPADKRGTVATKRSLSKTAVETGAKSAKAGQKTGSASPVVALATAQQAAGPPVKDGAAKAQSQSFATSSATDDGDDASSSQEDVRDHEFRSFYNFKDESDVRHFVETALAADGSINATLESRQKLNAESNEQVASEQFVRAGLLFNQEINDKRVGRHARSLRIRKIRLDAARQGLSSLSRYRARTAYQSVRMLANTAVGQMFAGQRTDAMNTLEAYARAVPKIKPSVHDQQDGDPSCDFLTIATMCFADGDLQNAEQTLKLFLTVQDATSPAYQDDRARARASAHLLLSEITKRQKKAADRSLVEGVNREIAGLDVRNKQQVAYFCREVGISVPPPCNLPEPDPKSELTAKQQLAYIKNGENGRDFQMFSREFLLEQFIDDGTLAVFSTSEFSPDRLSIRTIHLEAGSSYEPHNQQALLQMRLAMNCERAALAARVCHQDQKSSIMHNRGQAAAQQALNELQAHLQSIKSSSLKIFADEQVGSKIVEVREPVDAGVTYANMSLASAMLGKSALAEQYLNEYLKSPRTDAALLNKELAFSLFVQGDYVGAKRRFYSLLDKDYPAGLDNLAPYWKAHGAAQYLRCLSWAMISECAKKLDLKGESQLAEGKVFKLLPLKQWTAEVRIRTQLANLGLVKSKDFEEQLSREPL